MGKISSKFSSSLRRVFMTVVVIIYSITVIASLFAFFLSTKKISTEYVNRYAISQDLLEKNKIRALVDRELALSRKLADDPQIRKWILNEANPLLRKNAEEQLLSYKKYLGSGTQFIAIRSSNNYFINDIKKVGKVLEKSNEGDRWFFDAIKANQDYSLNVNFDSLTDDVRIWINVLVRDNQSNAIAVAGCGISISDFLDKLVVHQEPGLNTIIINSAGEIQAHKDRTIIEHNGRVKKDSDKTTIYNLISDPLEQEILKANILRVDHNAQIQLFSLHYNKQKVVAALGAIPELGWYNLLLVDENSVIGLKDFLPLALVLLISILLILASIVIIFNRLIQTPLSSLTSMADVVAKGSYNTTIPVLNNNEIGKLSQSFNTMTSEIRRYTGNLETMVEERTLELKTANQNLTQIQKRVMDSIQYAKLIQGSFLPSQTEMGKHFAENFVIFNPLDIVGGDFYFFREIEDGYFVACIDCTGHGVPGAFMTMMVNALLNRVIETNQDETPAQLLEKLHLLVQDTLRSKSETKHLDNGLDIALCKVSNSAKTLQFAGGGLPLIIACEGLVKEIPGDFLHLGFSIRKEYQFTNHEISLDEDYTYYLITDGVLDLPGGEKGFGLGRSTLMEIIKTRQSFDLEKQKLSFIEVLDNYRGTYAQKDDLVFLGFKPKVLL